MGRPPNPVVRRPSRRLGGLAVLGASALVAAAAALPPRAAAPAAAPAEDRVETPVPTGSPVTGVAESMVRVRVPLPSSAGPHPEACDWLSSLRFRDPDGPAASAQADKILVAQPGILEGAGA